LGKRHNPRAIGLSARIVAVSRADFHSHFLRNKASFAARRGEVRERMR
jgi:hypothetical protein